MHFKSDGQEKSTGQRRTQTASKSLKNRFEAKGRHIPQVR